MVLVFAHGPPLAYASTAHGIILVKYHPSPPFFHNIIRTRVLQHYIQNPRPITTSNKRITIASSNNLIHNSASAVGENKNTQPSVSSLPFSLVYSFPSPFYYAGHTP